MPYFLDDPSDGSFEGFSFSLLCHGYSCGDEFPPAFIIEF